VLWLRWICEWDGGGCDGSDVEVLDLVVDVWLMSCGLAFHDMRFSDRLQIQIC
jgi:Ni,Fe-hydrogenase III small subunit